MNTVIITIIVLLFIGFALGMHVAIALGMTALVTGMVFIGPIWDFFGQIPWNTTSGATLIVVPLFILMGELLLRSGITEDLYTAFAKWMDRMPGGLLHTNIAASGVFSAISGSSVATAVTIGGVALPSLKRRNYNERISLGSLAAGGTLGILLPPSIILIVYGLMAEVSIGRLYIAAIVPGLIMMAAFIAVIAVRVFLRPDMAPREGAQSYSLGEKIAGLVNVLPAMALILLVLGTIYGGIATAIEASAFGVTGALLIALLKRRVNLDMLSKCFVTTASTTGMVMLILIAAFLLQFVLAFTGIPAAITRYVVSLGLSELELVLLLCVIYLVLGMFMESMAMMVTTLPLILPLLNSMGVDLVWFGVILVIMIEVSLITPPVGMNLFVLQSLRRRLAGPGGTGSIVDLYVGAFPFVFAMLAVLLMVILLPDLAMFLVETMRGTG
ncbi:MAG: TRAP transporter large permease subunit [Vannielia sp.]|uniref:TRAP transporter large permease n=1 Tax=Rhodobacterales TaxID=204455 RepID=UPI0020954956|nr:TRAP transporter large permease subunit [Oceanicola sp. 502str15]MCO6384410.1 TRAP transporter large permease subunit [Oceanicola sp. 502str15]